MKDIDPPDVEALVAELRERIAVRERAGDQPPYLDADLAAQFARVVDSTPAFGDRERLVALLDRVRLAVEGSAPDHDMLAVLVDMVGEMANLLAASETRNTNLERRMDYAEYLIEELRRDQGGDPDTLSALRHRVDRLETELPASFAPPFSAAAFQEHFQDSGERQRHWYRHLAAQFLDVPGPVLDIGCGRGDLLVELQRIGIRATGVDTDPSVTAICRERGVDAELVDGLRMLERSGSGSFGGIVALQVIEHLDPGRAARLVELTFSKLAAGGKLILQTVNVESLFALARAFVIDPTHVQPVHHTYLEFLLASAGFDPVTVEFQSQLDDGERLVTPGDGPDANIDRLNEVLFAPQDYTVTGIKPAESSG